jgi:hypothetical protein
MLNPWLSFPLQAVRLGWEAQSMVVDQMMRLAGMSMWDQKPPSAPAADATASVEVEAPTAPVEVASPGNARKNRQATQETAKIQKGRGAASKHRRSE